MGRRANSDAILSAATTTTTGTAVSIWGNKRTYQAYGTTSAGAGAVEVAIEVSNVDNQSGNGYWLQLGTITLTLGTSVSSDGFASVEAWKWTRARVLSISGTNASVTVIAGSEGY